MLNKFKNEVKKIAAYCRVSTDNLDQANSLESQQRYFNEYINAIRCGIFTKFMLTRESAERVQKSERHSTE